MAPKEDGRGTRKGTALPSGPTYGGSDRAGPRSGGGATTGQSCARRSGAGEGEVPRRPGNTTVGGSTARPALRCANMDEETSLHFNRYLHARARHWGEHGDFQRDQ